MLPIGFRFEDGVSVFDCTVKLGNVLTRVSLLGVIIWFLGDGHLEPVAE